MRRLLLLLFSLTAAAWATSGVDSMECSAVVSIADWSVQYGGPDTVTPVNLPHDDWTSMIRGTTVGALIVYELGPTDIVAGSTVDSTRLVVRWTASTKGGLMLGLALGASASESDSVWNETDNFVTTVVKLARPGGGSYSVADLDTLRLRLKDIYSDHNPGVTTAFAEVFWTSGAAAAPKAASGAFMDGD